MIKRDLPEKMGKEEFCDNMNRQEYFRQIPKMDVVLKEACIQKLCDRYGRGFVKDCIRQGLDELRMVVQSAKVEDIENALSLFLENMVKKVEEESVYSLRNVCNATGIILHTNLGRAPLGKVQKEAMIQAMCGYSNLEYNLETGLRGKRWTHYADLVSRVTGAQGAIAVNNNAASLTLIFSALTKGKEIIVSRGESIEIGGKFRIPEVIEQSGARLKEVGTTNRTRMDDYERAITQETGALLKVHTSNYKVVGFTEEATLEELVALGKKYNLPVIMDLGSGVLINLEKYGLAHEPTVQEMVKKGADLICFSGDKLLGGPQAGIIIGKKEYIKMLEYHPLMRAIRLDKSTIAALMATFREYMDEARAVKNIPVLRMITRTQEELKEQAETIRAAVIDDWQKARIVIEPSHSMVGGGSLPGEMQESYAVTLEPKDRSCEEVVTQMRQLPVPIIAYIKENKIWLDMRTVLPEEILYIIDGLQTVLA